MPYWVHRTKNHMMPVYLKTGMNDPTITTISHIDGDIWVSYCVPTLDLVIMQIILNCFNLFSHLRKKEAES